MDLDRKTRITKDARNREITIERVLHAPRALVWNGLTSPAHIARWWGPRGWTTTVYQMDVRPGGLWHYCMRPDDQEEEVWGRAVYRNIEKPSQLTYVESFSDADGNIVGHSQRTVTVRLLDHGENTQMLVRTQFTTDEEMESMAKLGMAEGFSMTLDRFDELLTSHKAKGSTT
ncbi:SRPBCC family protein [Nocardia sp.]|uniref:SRPBCC family protein n=1 Tax=Nocardia sp. TaxID=1821 RepID=UPI0026165D0E|nr:SRPBCC domain-containing protein [Nocardia sp.]